MNKFSVLLLLPEYVDAPAPETFYAHVEGADKDEAIQAAKHQCWEQNQIFISGEFYDDLIVLLAIAGHHEALN